jgi:hypothetical protein
MHRMRKGQVRWLCGEDVRGQIRFTEHLFGLAE